MTFSKWLEKNYAVIPYIGADVQAAISGLEPGKHFFFEHSQFLMLEPALQHYFE